MGQSERKNLCLMTRSACTRCARRSSESHHLPARYCLAPIYVLSQAARRTCMRTAKCMLYLSFYIFLFTERMYSLPGRTRQNSKCVKSNLKPARHRISSGSSKGDYHWSRGWRSATLARLLAQELHRHRRKHDLVLDRVTTASVVYSQTIPIRELVSAWSDVIPSTMWVTCQPIIWYVALKKLETNEASLFGLFQFRSNAWTLNGIV